MKIEKINKETEKGVFEILFRDGNWGVNKDQVTPILKALVKQHNNMVDVVNKLLIHNVSGSFWRDVDVELPKTFTGVLGYIKEQDHIAQVYFENDNTWTEAYTTEQVKGITHWMPLPKTPKELNII